MSRRFEVARLLELGPEPSFKSYKEAVQSVVEDPQSLVELTEEHVKGQLLVNLTTNSDRLAQFFHHLQSALPPFQSQETHSIAEYATSMLVQLLPDIHQLLRQESQRLVRLLCPVIEVCLAPSQPRGLHGLARVVSRCHDLLQDISTDPCGSAVIRQWTCFPGTQALDIERKTRWTHDLASMVSSCPGLHNIAPTIHHWGKIVTVMEALQDLEALLASEESRRVTRKIGTEHPFPDLDEELVEQLRFFGLQVPGSRRVVQAHIEALSNDHTPPILVTIAASFPCKRCMSGPSPASESLDSATNERNYVTDISIDVLGEGIGIWKVLLSEPVLKNFQAMSRQGIENPINAKLTDLASGYWDTRATGSAGSGKQKKILRIPLTNTECGRKLSILWQISTSTANDAQAMQQVILIWEISDRRTISGTIDRVIELQKSYSEEKVRHCLQRLRGPNELQLPARFEEDSAHHARSGIGSAMLDVETVDQTTIQMSNKFYTVTSPMIRSVLANDLAAEFPMDLSQDEARCIAHFQTATLILGRSGTGKTTCLIFKMVGKYLTSKAATGARPARQILLTRSSFLVEKIRAYTRRLLRTLESKRVDSGAVQLGQSSLAHMDEDRTSDSVLNLRDRMFPLVCTFDRFLQLVENTATALDRQDFRDMEAANSQATSGTERRRSRLIDFYGFKVDYWPRLSQTLVKGISAHLVFSEIMGVIKGSEASRDSLVPLNRNEYLARSSRLAPTFANENDRFRVYDIYIAYEALKSQHGDFDHMDRVVRLLRAVRKNNSLAQVLQASFDEFYVDEVQDQRCLDLELLMNMVRDGRGFHFAGDTAQAISQDSTFRFEDAQKMLYSHFAPAMKSTNQPQLGRATRFALSKNYRSHQGILALASLVMDMIWKGFPETLDKLPPEIGDLSGPKPVLIIGCDVDILRASNVGSGKLSERSADFGAEQVILVRDADMKALLQREIGDIALILTIGESKGMEFDDVILWDFFTGCPDQAGVRSLRSLKSGSTKFDPREHSGMCSELKNLYVAVTRARSQLFMIETSQVTAATVKTLLACDNSGTITEVTGPDHEDFHVRIEMMRPSTSVDPAAWARRAEEFIMQRYYKEALMSFRRAGDRRGEIIAQGYVREEEGSICFAKDHVEEATQHFEAACAHFLEVKLIADAIRVLEKAKNWSKAAAVLEEQERYPEAASFHLRAGSYVEAVRCHHKAENHSEAVAILRNEVQYDRMVAYVSENIEKFSTQDLRGYSLFCKLLLKQSKLSANCRKYAINLLGSPAEQEKCFAEYGMDEELTALYIGQRRFVDLYRLYHRTGRLEKALGLLCTKKDLMHPNGPIPQSEAIQLLDYCWAGHLTSETHQTFEEKLNLASVFLTPSMAARNDQWMAIVRMGALHGPDRIRPSSGMADTPAKWFLIFRAVLKDKSIAGITSLDSLPFEVAQEALRFVKGLVLRDDPDDVLATLILAGIWMPSGAEAQHLVLPWSTIRRDTNLTDVATIAKQRVVGQFSTAILSIELKTQSLWTSKWPSHCAYFLTQGSCRDKLNGRCQRLHEKISGDRCSRILEGLLRINRLFCDLAVLYYQKSLKNDLQAQYQTIRRRWLEILLRELAFLSAVMQHVPAIAQTRTALIQQHEYQVINSSLQELLYFRLGKEWTSRNDFTSLIEQIQFAEALGSIVRTRLFRAISNRLHFDGRDRLQQHLVLLSTLVFDGSRLPAPVFREGIARFLSNLTHIEGAALSTLYALTAVFEALATYLMMKTCSTACLLKQSWIDLHLSRYLDDFRSDRVALSFEHIHTYQQCLIELAKAFSGILEKAHYGATQFLCSGRNQHPSLLWQRNTDLLAVIVANLAALSVPPNGFGAVCAAVNRIFSINAARASHLKGRNSTDLCQQLALGFQTYNGKDNLLVVVKDRKKGLAFADLDRQPGVKSVAFEELCPRASAPDPQAPAIVTPEPPSTQVGIYFHTDVQAVTKLQRLWRSHSLRSTARKAYMLLPRAQLIERFIRLGAQCRQTVAVRERITTRYCLVTKGVALYSMYEEAQTTVRALRDAVMSCVEKVEIAQGVDEAVDRILTKYREVEGLVGIVGTMLADESLVPLVSEGLLLDIEHVLQQVEHLLGDAEGLAKQTGRAVNELSKASNSK